jgi:glucose/arabinose dehydrogenase/mono/diheme cytochrome c family protein
MLRYIVNRFNLYVIAFCAIGLPSCQEKKYRDEIYEKPVVNQNPEIKNLSPEESLKSMYLPKGYRMEVVASEPMIAEPVSIAWDGNGKMYVAQMMTYMQDIDGTNEDAPWSRISVLEDTDGDGKMDKSVVFLDSLVLPRIMFPLDDRLIVGETYNRNLYSYKDTNGDGVADEKILLLEDTVRDNRNLEHQDANMIWGIDNWLYVTNKAFRYRFTNNVFVRDTLPEQGTGQWGLTQDATGRLFFSRAGSEIPALGFQQPPIYGNLEMEGKWDDSFMEPWPIVKTLDVQGGPRRIREGDSTLNKFTGVAGQEIFLGDKIPPASGDLFIPEPVGRLVRRAKVLHVDGKIVLENPYKQTEFLASTDPLFRPVGAATGPDGCLYIVDMYRGIIQEGNWVGEGSYLRDVVKEKGYDKFVGRGRIYRIVHEDMEPGARPELLKKTAADLVDYLGHPNGWWRYTAQKLIVLKKDKVVPDLVEMVEGNESWLAKLFNSTKDFGLERLHALWTLEGLDAIDKPILKTALKDKDPRVRVGAIRISDRYLKEKDAGIFEALKALANDSDAEVLQQLILSMRINNELSKPIVKAILDSHPNNELIKITAGENLNPSFSVINGLREKYKLRGRDTPAQIVNGYTIFKEFCSTCHGADGKGIHQLAPSLVGSPRVTGDVEVPIRILLHGLTGPINGVEYNGPMASVGKENDKYIADVLTYVRIHLNDAGTVGEGRVKAIRAEAKDRNKYWTLKELEKEQKARAEKRLK